MIHRALSEPCTFALLQWPALVGLLAITETGPLWLALRVLLGLWLTLMLIAAYAGGRGAGFGNAMLLQCGLVAAAWWMHPSAWAFAWLAAIPLLMLVAQRLRLQRMEMAT
ncbi:hypothetical protein ACS5PN_03355 [Roseateles sp. NT4]|uniref:hypothetical protein n=1 Tax=Roseateles sp. NT4 TaxID=3453715 RepID=UPI003EEB747C